MAAIKKKGIFFTFIAITVMVVFVLILKAPADISLQKDTQSIRIRIDAINNFVDDLENRYFETVLRATTYKTIISLIYFMNETDSYLTDLDSAFYEVILNGTINGVPIDSRTGKKIMDNNTLINWSKRIIEASKDTLNVNTTIILNNVSLFQTKPWNIESRISFNFTIKSNVAEWEKSSIVTTTNSIEGLYDPYYLVNTNGLYNNKVKMSTVEFNQWNISKVREHLRNGTYLYWQNSNAPSFLMRFTNDISSSSCCGIESLVSPNAISPSDQIESYADYLFWSHQYLNNCSQLYNITGLWDEFRFFKLDFDHVIKYNITSQYYTPC